MSAPARPPAEAASATAPRGHDVPADERRAALERELRARFRYAGDGDATQVLFRAALAYLVERSS